MCGIAGSVAGQTSARERWVRQATETMTHRGPDAGGLARFDACTLGHRRLRILDLSEAADQPMANEDASVWVAFNGEIYNHAELREELRRSGHEFRTGTDTEVLVHLYEESGTRMVQRLRGMFGFAIWDERRRTLMLARDRLGIKPLYYRRDGQELKFASEARSLAGGAGLDLPAVAGYLRLGWVPGPGTIFEGVRELEPGHLLTWEAGETTVTRWWSPRPGPATSDLRGVLKDSFSRHLVSDVPVGLFLSAGVDSAALAHLAVQAQSDLKALTVCFDSGPDEAGEAAALAGRLGLSHTEVRIKGGDVLEDLERIVADMDQPTVDGVNNWVISRAARKSGLTVALSGLGGDELFGGYSTFGKVPMLAAAGRAAGMIPPSLRRRAAELAAGRATSHSVRRAAGAIAEGGWAEAYASMRGVTGADEHRRLVPWAGGGLGETWSQVKEDGLGAVTGLELHNYLPYQLLRDTDAMSMAHGLEVRVPLLDDEVVSCALGLQPGGPRGKRVLAEAVDPSLIPLTTLKKRTFTLPFDAWLHGPLQEPARAALDTLAGCGLGIEAREVDAIWSRYRSGRTHWRTVWSMVVLGLWIEGRRSAGGPPG